MQGSSGWKTTHAHHSLGAPSILVTNFLVKSPTKSPISNHQFFCFKSSKCAVWFSCDCGLKMFIATELYSTFWWLETEKSVIWNCWLGWWLHQKIGDSNGRRALWLCLIFSEVTNCSEHAQMWCSLRCECANYKNGLYMWKKQKHYYLCVTQYTIYRIVSNKRSPSNKRPPNLFSNKTR